jgi:uncharacterized protein YggL (DUF469 family)
MHGISEIKMHVNYVKGMKKRKKRRRIRIRKKLFPDQFKLAFSIGGNLITEVEVVVAIMVKFLSYLCVYVRYYRVTWY